MKILRYMLGLTLMFAFISATNPEKKETRAGEVEWISFEEALKRNENEPRKILVDFYTDWCGWCKRMDRDVYAKAEITEYLNDNFYAVKFNAEKYKEDIEFHGHTFKFVPPPEGGRNGIHELAYALMNKKASYPMTVFIDEELNPLQAIPGYQKAPFFDTIIKYIGGDKYKNTPWQDFQSAYQSPLGP